MRSYGLQQHVYDMSVASYQQACCKLIVSTCYPEACCKRLFEQVKRNVLFFGCIELDGILFRLL